VAWKVRTSAPAAFLVAPRAGLLASKGTVEVQITLLPSTSRGDLRLEVRAVAVEEDRETLNRTDWRSFPDSTHQVARLHAALTSSGDGQRFASQDSLRDRGQPDDSRHRVREDKGFDAEQDAALLNRYGSSNGLARRSLGTRKWEPDRPPRQSLDDSFDMYDASPSSPRETLTRRPAAQRATTNGTGVSAGSSESSKRAARVNGTHTSNSKSVDQGDGVLMQKPPPMSPLMKGFLGVLIAVLVVNLYLRPLVGMAVRQTPGSGNDTVN